MTPLVIVGNSEIARIAYEYFTYDSDYDVIAFSVDPDYVGSGSFLGKPVIPLPELEKHHAPEDGEVFVAMGSGQLNRLRTRFFDQMHDRGYRMASYVSSRAFVWRNVAIGQNCFILENNTVQPFVKIGHNVTLWSGNHIGHGSVIRNNVFVSSQVVISGLCEIGESSFLGVNSCIAEETKIAPDNFIAMGAAVSRSTEPDQVLIGNPAAPHKVGAKRFCRVKP